MRGTGAAERAWTAVRAREPLYPHRWAFLNIPAQWPRTDCPPGRLSLDGLLSLPKATLISPGQGKDTLPSLGELAAAQISSDATRFPGRGRGPGGEARETAHNCIWKGSPTPRDVPLLSPSL